MLTMTPAPPLPTLLAASKVTRKALAEAVGVSPGYISDICVGRHRPSRQLRISIARALNVDEALLWPEQEQP